jgi:hypothetical protein
MGNPYDGIIANIFVGNDFAANFHGGQFELIVNCAFGLPCPENHKNCFHLPIHQSEKETKNYFDMIKSTEILEKIHDLVLANKPVLIYCLQGMHRSCTLCACYLIKYHNLTVQEAKKVIKSRRSIAFNPIYNLEDTMNLFFNHINYNGYHKTTRDPLPEPTLPYLF